MLLRVKVFTSIRGFGLPQPTPLLDQRGNFNPRPHLIMENPYLAPQAEIINPSGTHTPLTWKQILFSFQGRIPRRQ